MEQKRVTTNAYTHNPQLYANPIAASCQLLAWFLFHPTAWQNYITQIDPTLPPQFCLAELSFQQWRRPALQRLLIIGFLIWPLLVAPIVVLGLGLKGAISLHLLWGLGLGIGMGLVFGIVMSMTTGMAVALVASITLAMMLGGKDTLLKDVIFGKSFGTTLGLIAGVASYMAIHSVIRTRDFSSARQLGGVVLGLLISGGFILGAASAVAAIATSWQGGILSSSGIAFIMWVVPISLLSSMIWWRTRRWQHGLSWGTGVGVLIGFVFWLLFHDIALNEDLTGFMLLAVITFVVVTVFTLICLVSYVLTERIAGTWAGAIAGGIGGQAIHLAIGSQYLYTLYNYKTNLWISFGVILFILTVSWWRPKLSYPFVLAWNTLLYSADERRTGRTSSLLRWHAAFWDEYQRWRMVGLDDHLLWVMEHYPAEGQTAMSYLAQSPHRWAAQTVQIELDARQLERLADVEAIGYVYRSLGVGELASPVSALLRSFSRISEDLAAALSQSSAYHQRLALRAVLDHLDGLLRELTRSNERHAERFHPIAERWHKIISEYTLELAETVESRQEIDNPYVTGVPLMSYQEIFVGRVDISNRIENLLLDQRRPPLLLYGQRRMGKTSLLNNLGRLLPHAILPLFVDLQGTPTSAEDERGFLYNIARSMIGSARRERGLSLPSFPREILEYDPFTRFDEWLDEVEIVTDAHGYHTILLSLDEFEALDKALREGRFRETAVLGNIRHLIQHRTRFKVLLAGSHTLNEFQYWASYLINAQVVHISYLDEEAAYQLIERPVKGFTLRYQPEASQHAFYLTRGHPYLVQLLCGEIVNLKNEQEPNVRRMATVADVETAASIALSSGSMFFGDIQQNQIDEDGLALLRFLARQGEGTIVDLQTLFRQCSHPDKLDSTLSNLIRREVIEVVDNGYRFQVELTRRWFASPLSVL